MIPKIIHYCWFSGEEMTPFIKRCMASWKKVMPDYQLRLWDANSFDFDSVPFVKEAFKAHKWAFVTDYVRLYALYKEGGIYMDTDVKVMRRYDEFLQYSFFTCQEYHPDMVVPESIMPDGTRNPAYRIVPGIGVQAAMIGAERGCVYLKECIEYYHTLHFDVSHKEDFIIVGLIARLMEKYGYRYIMDDQYLEKYNMMILNPSVCAGMTTLTGNSYSIHLYNGSWLEENHGLKHKLRNQFPMLYGFLQSIFHNFRRFVGYNRQN